MINWIKDKSIFFSFDATGFSRHQKAYKPLGSVVDKHFLITGGTRGIGAEIALGLQSLGAVVTVTGRQPSLASKQISTNGGHFVPLDLLQPIAQQVEGLKERRFDGVILNAGAMPDQCTRFGEYESIFYSQVVAHLSLVSQLIKQKSVHPQAHFHFMASGGLYTQKLSMSDLNFTARPYNKLVAYANAKRAQLELTGYLAQTLPNYCWSVSHPGWVATEGLKLAMPKFYQKLAHRLRTPAQGADTAIWCMSEPNLPSGKFWFDRREAKSHLSLLYPFTQTPVSDRLQLQGLANELLSLG